MKSFTLAIGAFVGVLSIGTGTALAEDNRIDQIKERSEIMVCHAEALPWGAKDPTGNWVGTDIEAARHLTGIMGVD